MSTPRFDGDLKRMVGPATDVATQIVVRCREAGMPEVALCDLADITAHLLTIVVDAAAKSNMGALAIHRFRDTFERAIRFEGLPATYLSAIASAPTLRSAALEDFAALVLPLVEADRLRDQPEDDGASPRCPVCVVAAPDHAGDCALVRAVAALKAPGGGT